MSTGVIDRWGPPVAVASAAVSGAALVAAGGVRWWGGQRGLPVYEWFPSDVVVGLLIPAVGAVLVSRQPRNLAGWVLTAGALVGVGAFARQYAFYGGVVAPGTLPLVGVATWLAAWTFVAFWVQPSLLALLFPDGRPASPRWRRVTQVIFGLVVAGALAAAFRPDPNVEDLGLANPLGVGTVVWPFAVVMMVASFGAMLGGGVLGVWSLVVRARDAQGRDRAQVQWLLLGFAGFVLFAVGGLVFEDPSGEVMFTVGLACIPAAVAIAVARHQLFDVEIVVNRTIVYVLLTGVGLVAYVVLVAVGTSLAGDRVPEAIVAAVVALGAVMARQRVQGFVDRRLFGARNDPYAVVETVGSRIGQAVGPQAALDGVVAAVRETLRVPYVAVVPVDPAMPGAAVGHPVAEVEELPVVWQGRRLATLRVGSRHRRGRFSDVERSVLADVAQRAGAVLHAATLTEELSRSWQAAVAAREEERRRLRRDLHDGLGPALAGVALGLDGLGRRLGNDRSLAQRADQLRGQLRDAVGEVRHIVEGLRPFSLDELGLAGAVERLASTDGDRPRISVEVEGPVPALPAAVEVAAYRIAAEAVTNAVRHADADVVDVRLRIQDDDLEIAVYDDGRGFGTEIVSGVGLRSMHERAAEVGGDLQVRSTADGGTSVVARLPLETM
jgi:signal transduction histidine kinase